MSDVVFWLLVGGALWCIAGLVVALFVGQIPWGDDDD